MRTTEDLLSVERPVIAQLPDIDQGDFLLNRAVESGFGAR